MIVAVPRRNRTLIIPLPKLIVLLGLKPCSTELPLRVGFIRTCVDLSGVCASMQHV